MSGLSLGTCTSNLKTVALTVLNWSDWPLRCTHRQTDRTTLNEHIISAIHFVHLAEIKCFRKWAGLAVNQCCVIEDDRAWLTVLGRETIKKRQRMQSPCLLRLLWMNRIEIIVIIICHQRQSCCCVIATDASADWLWMCCGLDDWTCKEYRTLGITVLSVYAQ